MDAMRRWPTSPSSFSIFRPIPGSIPCRIPRRLSRGYLERMHWHWTQWNSRLHSRAEVFEHFARFQFRIIHRGWTFSIDGDHGDSRLGHSSKYSCSAPSRPGLCLSTYFDFSYFHAPWRISHCFVSSWSITAERSQQYFPFCVVITVDSLAFSFPEFDLGFRKPLRLNLMIEDLFPEVAGF